MRAIETLGRGYLMLTPLVLGDAPEMVHVLADAELYEFTGGRPPSLPDLELRYEHQLRGPSPLGRASDDVWLNWIVREAASGKALGFAQATVTRDHDGEIADLAWLIGTAHQGNGYATHAAELVAYWLSDQSIERLRAHIHPKHLASQGVAANIQLEDSEKLDADGEQIWTWEY